MKKLPIFDIKLNDEDLKQGVNMISLVDEPAIGVNWIKLNKMVPTEFKLSTDKQILYGPFLIPNMLIYRNDEVNGEYYVRFSKEEIEKIANKFNEDLNMRNINFMHSDKKVEAFVSENWLIEGDTDKSKKFNFDLPEGTWFGGVKVKDLNFWTDKVKGEEVKGFSVEILADLELALKNKENKMKELKFKKKFIGKQKFDDAVEVESGEIIVVAEEIAVGQECIVIMDDLVVVETWDGTVEVGGETIVIEAGQITEVMGSEEPIEPIEEMSQENLEEGSVSLTAEEVSLMIDQRFNEIMEEISKIKVMVDEKEREEVEYRKVVEEKFKTTPGAQSIKKSQVSFDEKFTKVEDRIRSFAKNLNS
jgi:hypothetical protein